MNELFKQITNNQEFLLKQIMINQQLIKELIYMLAEDSDAVTNVIDIIIKNTNAHFDNQNEGGNNEI